MKVAILGGGGFRTPTLHGRLSRAADRLGIEEVVLHDVDRSRLSSILAVVEGLDRERAGAPLAVRPATSLEDAVEGAGAVLAAIRVGGTDAREIDEDVPLSLGVLGQETVGPAGIAFALRTIPVMRRIAAVVRDRSPTAWFVNFTNPAGIVTEAVRSVAGERVVGICDSPAALCARVAAALGRRASTIGFDYAGLNHLGWLLAAAIDGDDALPDLLQDDRRLAQVEEGRLFGADRIRSLGAVPNEYLVYLDRAKDVTASFLRSGARGGIVATQQRAFYEAGPQDPKAALATWRRTRDARHGTYMAEAWDSPETHASAPTDAPTADPDGPGEDGYAAVAVDFLEAATGAVRRRIVLDTANRGRLVGASDDEVVEVSCEVDRDGVRPVPGRTLPPEAAALVQRIKEVERSTLRASESGSAALALEAIAAHPVVPSREVAECILDGYLARHETMRELLR
jgi:6-phospho-beta-glucosidase